MDPLKHPELQRFPEGDALVVEMPNGLPSYVMYRHEHKNVFQCLPVHEIPIIAAISWESKWLSKVDLTKTT